MEKNKRQPPIKENRIRQSVNLAMLTGWWHNKYYIKGIVQLPKKKN